MSDLMSGTDPRGNGWQSPDDDRVNWQCGCRACPKHFRTGLHCEHRHEPELRALAVRARTLLDEAAEADARGVALSPGSWREEFRTWALRYQAYLEAEAARR
jgi:hypothetical protein